MAEIIAYISIYLLLGCVLLGFFCCDYLHDAYGSPTPRKALFVFAFYPYVIYSMIRCKIKFNK